MAAGAPPARTGDIQLFTDEEMVHVTARYLEITPFSAVRGDPTAELMWLEGRRVRRGSMRELWKAIDEDFLGVRAHPPYAPQRSRQAPHLVPSVRL